MDEILQTEDEGDIGFLVKVDLEYSEELHDKYADYQLLPDKDSIDPLELSDFQTSLRNTFKLTASKTKRLTQTFHPEKYYVVHYRNLKFYVNNVIKITKVQQAAKFRQFKGL